MGKGPSHLCDDHPVYSVDDAELHCRPPRSHPRDATPQPLRHMYILHAAERSTYWHRQREEDPWSYLHRTCAAGRWPGFPAGAIMYVCFRSMSITRYYRWGGRGFRGFGKFHASVLAPAFWTLLVLSAPHHLRMRWDDHVQAILHVPWYCWKTSGRSRLNRTFPHSE